MYICDNILNKEQFKEDRPYLGSQFRRGKFITMGKAWWWEEENSWSNHVCSQEIEKKEHVMAPSYKTSRHGPSDSPPSAIHHNGWFHHLPKQFYQMQVPMGDISYSNHNSSFSQVFVMVIETHLFSFY